MRRLVGVLLLVAVTATACSSSKKSGAPISSLPATTPATSSSSTSAAPTTSTTSQSSTPAAAGLSGTWDGHYSGGYVGTFTLIWQQTGSTLTGTIKLSNPPDTLPINGTVSGGAIRVGTVGSAAITYSGSVSGGSMSGSYTVAGSSGGSWSATKM